jgi:hypothetical protein
MNVAKCFALLTPIILATGFSQPLTHAQAPHVLLTSTFKHILVQHSTKSPSQPMKLVSAPPPVDGRPDDRVPAGTHAT